MQTIYKIAVLGFYYLGDFACRFNNNFAYDVYQKSMKLSIQFDEKIGWWYWKEPLNTNNDL